MLILSVAAPRTGSSRFGQLLQSMQSEFVCEPFHAQASIHCAEGPSGLRFYARTPYILSDFGRAMAADPLIQRILPSRALRMQSVPRRTASHLHQISQRLRERERLRPARLLSVLLETAGAAIGPAYNIFREPRIARRVCELLDAREETYTLELFPNHLAPECHDFLCRTYPLILHQRSLIDSYVSLIKTDSRRWNRVDTTGYRVRICPESFVTYCRSISDYYLRSLQTANDPGKPCAATTHGQPRSCVINYEDWCDQPNHAQGGRVHQLLEQNGFAHVYQKPVAAGSSDALNRQDQASDWADKVTNAAEVIDALEQRSLQGLLGARPLEIPALGVPWAQEPPPGGVATPGS
ncbi:hypothetical protein KBY84_00950 [Cyanobium sp. N.Huapi 1H5]|uniref:hypothetical protein n=1 Tax=Cyanobium sp. N.Huapi 1H5 TaxID=2823719 RepID=UPI0020CDD51E|nr:hypothetical protein [Cyanobium sp. N.Huapi 1H5]MCP9836056.1 hypothetical protein [Cyanobium sp. N.Huapi 1H5]